MRKKRTLSKSTIIWISTILLVLGGTGIWGWKRFGPSEGAVYHEIPSELPVAVTLDSAANTCDLTVRRYKQIGKELQFELAANAGGLAPYEVELTQNGKSQHFAQVPHRTNIWLTLPNIDLANGKAVIRVKSLGQSGCETSAEFSYDAQKKNEILDDQHWVRQGSKDNWLDIRPVVKDGRIYLKDFANFQDGRTKVVLIDNIVVTGLENGIEVKPGYLYSILAKWIDAPYNDWWNKLRNRSVRQQNIWIGGQKDGSTSSSLTKIDIPAWYAPKNDINVHFDTDFPEFKPIEGKLVMQYRLNEWVPSENYFKRGITHLPAWEKTIPAEKMHWTAPPAFFQDQKAEWFAKLSRQEVEKYAANVSPFGAYAFDFEFWNQIYPDDVKQRLIWFAKKVRENNPNMYLFDYWGGSAYTNPHFNTMGDKKPGDFIKDYDNPKPNHTNYDPLPNGDSFQGIYSVSPADVYPRPSFAVDEQGNTPNNFTLLSAIHALRINEKIAFQKNNKSIFYAWNRYMPLYQDPIVPWHLETTNPKGDLIVNQLEMMPASQALSMSLFSLILFDGYYIWHDSKPWGKGKNAYKITPESTDWGKEWYPADAKTDISIFNREVPGGEAPRYWDYPTEFYALGNWMAKQVEDVIVDGKNQDLAFELNGEWHKPQKGQAAAIAGKKEPFVSSIVKDGKIVVLAVDCFQSPTTVRNLKIKLPDGTVTSIQLYGNWPSLYRGTVKK